MKKNWTEIQEINTNYKKIAIFGIYLENGNTEYLRYCVDELTKYLPPELHYYALITNEVEFPTRIDYYKKLWKACADNLPLTDSVLSKEYMDQSGETTTFYGVIEFTTNIASHIFERLNDDPDTFVFGDEKPIEELDIPNIFRQNQADPELTNGSYPIQFQFLNAGFEAGLYVTISEMKF
ncbi:hypothetical protein PWEIH_02182 [Listeria weihenstephanensis FSL R9-0317]|uniref:Uncharacterized protein n=1 Tax=Listeria weihenstephanensis TaxID=1006155 RepID=A0A1S7FQV1_9LIST|nr:hypothetical protein [Listeria weihenstephanensis]AQY49777.1 hypothetical protein UE46_01000 [Listeria weihenstephanensis]EUJ41078.1 hypothetical protein PWEIH_02182 [Listeria weihenstephanensis FSL R9-0317]